MSCHGKSGQTKTQEPGGQDTGLEARRLMARVPSETGHLRREDKPKDGVAWAREEAINYGHGVPCQLHYRRRSSPGIMVISRKDVEDGRRVPPPAPLYD